ncbi:hypothetical protein vseg_018018 [Gypsophila vaccaria]
MLQLEKPKVVRVEFRLQFHATHIPQTGWNNLFVSIIPDSCKATAKTSKTNVRNRSCVWADPIYETTRLLHDPKTNQYEEKVYRLVVAMGTSRSSLLGEAQINLSDYLDSSKPSVVALPLHGSDCGAILHVLVQLLTSKAGLREVEPLSEVSDRGLPANTDFRKLSTLGKAMVSRTDKVDPRLRFKPNSKEIRSLEVESGFSKEYPNTTAGSDGSTNTSGSLCAEKHYNSRSHEIDGIKRTLSGDTGRGSPSGSPTIDKGRSDHPFSLHVSRNSVHQWGQQIYVNREVAVVYEENNRLKRVLEEANLFIDELRKEIDSLQNFALSSKENLAKEVSKVKVECLKFKHDLEIVRNIKIAAKKVDIVPGVESCHATGALLPGLVTSETSSVGGGIALQGEFSKLLREVDESKAERDNLERKMAQMECYYEAMIHELEETQKKMLGELQNLRHEHSSCIYTVSSTKAQMEMMHQQMNSERLLNKELERRAAASEAALRKARMNYSISVNQLQKDLGVLSLQVLSMYGTNEYVTGKSLEASQPSLRGCEDAEIASHVDESSNVDPCEESQSRDAVLKTSLDLKSSVSSSRDDYLYKKMQEELSEMLLDNVNLNVFSVTLHQSLLEASLDSRAEMHELAEQLKLSCRSNQSLRMKLKNFSDEICTLNNKNAVLTLKNQTLEVKLRSFTDEKCVLIQRIGELESLVAEYINSKVKYESCEVEKEKLATQLEQVATDKHRLSNEVSLLKEEVMTMTIKVEEYEKLQKMENYIQDRLENLLVTDSEQVNGLLPPSEEENDTVCEKFMSIITCFHDKILQLTEEKKIVLNERDVACVSFASAKAEVMVLKQGFEHDLREMVSKLNLSSVLAEKLQTGVVAVSNKMQDSSEKEEKSTRMIEDLLSRFTQMEASLQELTLENSDLVDRIMAFGSLSDDLEDNRSNIRELKQKNRTLTEVLQNNIDESELLSKEFDNLKKTTGGLQDEISLLRGIRDQLDSQILDLNSQLRDRDDKLTQFDQQKAELNHLKQQLSDVESEKISLLCQLNERDDKLNEFERQEAELNHLKRQLSDVESENIRLQCLLKVRDDNFTQFERQEAELNLLKQQLSDVESENISLLCQLNERDDKLNEFECQEAEFNHLEQQLLDVESEKISLQFQLKARDDTLTQFECQEAELNHMKQQLSDVELEKISLLCQLKASSNKLTQFERQEAELNLLKQQLSNLESEKISLLCQLNERDDKLNEFECQEAEFNHLKQQLLDVESEKISLQFQLKARDDTLTQFERQEAELNHLKQQLLEVESERTRLQHQLSYTYEQLKKALEESANNSESRMLQMHGFLIAADVVQTVINQYKLHVEELFWEREYVNKNLKEADKTRLDNYASENAKLLSDVESLKSILEFNVALNQALERTNHSNLFEIGELKCLLRSYQTEIEDLVVSNEELEIRSLVLETTIAETSATIISHEQRNHHRVYDKKKFDRSSFASQDSLRIAFIKEEYETKLEEIRHLLSISEKHGEEMLLKLQDALNDLERRKKREASQLKRNEQLVLKIAELETELNLIVSENRENFAAYEQLKAELDCSSMSLDCCKEENIQLVSSLQECNDCNRKLSYEVGLLKEELQNLKESNTTSDWCHVVNDTQNNSSDVGNLLESSLISSPARCKEAGLEGGNLTSFSDDQTNCWAYTKILKLNEQYGREADLRTTREALVTDATDGLSDRINSDIDVEHNGYLLKDQLKPQFLMSVIERFREQLEQMKSENTLLPDGENLDELSGEVSHRDQLHQVKVSEELENTSSLYGDSSRSGHIFGKGLAKALQAKNLSMQFLSSFTKQLDSREAAVSESFGSVNELIKDTLEMKEGYAAMETELREMHERFSKLSLNFAEVEGERQKLVLMLKNVRPSKSVLRRSLTCSHEGLSS